MPIEKERSEKVRREIWELSKVKRPIKKTPVDERKSLVPTVERLITKCEDIEYDEINQPDKWRRQIARDLNWILSRAEYCLTTDGDASDVAFARAALRIVARVAEFEGIRRAKP